MDSNVKVLLAKNACLEVLSQLARVDKEAANNLSELMRGLLSDPARLNNIYEVGRATIDTMLYWRETPQGHDYWSRVNYDYDVNVPVEWL